MIAIVVSHTTRYVGVSRPLIQDAELHSGQSAIICYRLDSLFPAVCSL